MMNPLLPVDVWNFPTTNSSSLDYETLRLQQQMQRPQLAAALSQNPSAALYELSLGGAASGAGLHALIPSATASPRRLSLLSSSTPSIHHLQQQQLLSPTALALQLEGGRRNSSSLSLQQQAAHPLYDEFYHFAAQEAAAVARATTSPSSLSLLDSHPNVDDLLRNHQRGVTSGTSKKNLLSGSEEDSKGRLLLPKGYQPTQYDVLCGRDKLAFNHLGNQRFRAIIASYLPRYQQSKSRSERSKLHTEILRTVETMMGGFFLKQCDVSSSDTKKAEEEAASHTSESTSKSSKKGNSKTKEEMRWVEVSNREKIDKVGHAIRDASAKAEKRKKGATRHNPAALSKPSGSSMSITTGAADVEVSNKLLQEELSSMRMMLASAGGRTAMNPTAASFLYHS